MRLHTFDDIRRTVSANALDKATRYQRRRLARVTAMAKDGTSIEGQVKGTQIRPYTVTVSIEPLGNGRVEIEGVCTCPVGYNCKHVAALLIESMSRNGGGAVSAPQVFVPQTKAAPPPPSPPPPP
ncbi:MAG TPA: SWIM zinc finger family protein, partial [Rhodospirillales bacterium]|nr:SWIM zinc finger family protein [Rhodospirillales bacterium]